MKDRLRYAPLMGIVVVLLPFFLVFTFPSQDVPAHLDTARLAALLGKAAPTVSSVYELAVPTLSNGVAPWLLAMVSSLTSALTAEWLIALFSTALICLLIVLTPSLLGRDRRWALLALPMAIPLMLYMGSISLVLAYPAVFLALACATAYLQDRKPIFLVFFVILSVIAFFIQVQSVLVLVAAVLGGAIGVAAWQLVRGGVLSLQPLLPLSLATTPAIALIGAYMSTMSSGSVDEQTNRYLLKSIYAVLMRLEVAQFSVFDRALLALTLILAVLIALGWAYSRWRARKIALAPAWAFAGTAAVFALVLVLPYGTKAVPQIPQRILPVAHYMAFLWFATASPRGRWSMALLGLSVLFLAVSSVERTVAHARFGQYMRDLTEAEERVPSGSVVIPFSLGRIAREGRILVEQGGIDVGFEAWYHRGRGYGDRDIVSLGNYQAEGSYPFFQITYRPEWRANENAREPDLVVLTSTSVSQMNDWIKNFEAVTSRRVSHVIVNTDGLDMRKIDSPYVRNLAEFLDSNFTRQSASQNVELWVRR